MARRLRFDWLLFAILVGLCLFGLIMLYSASAVIATNRWGGSPYFFLRRQLEALVAGLLLGGIAMTVDYRRWRSPRLLYSGLISAGVLLIGVIFFGPEINGTHRWVALGPISFQPSELAKIPFLIFLAHWLDIKHERLDDVPGTLLPLAAVIAGFAGLVLLQPDFGTAVLYLAVAATLLFLAGLPLRWFAAGLPLVPILALAVVFSEYRMKRITAFLNPESDPLGSGFQALQSLIAHGSGGLFGAGLGNSRQKLFFLPEPHTDFVFSIIGEELGVIGVVAVLALLGLFLWRALRTARSAPDRFGYYLAAGIGAMIVIQALLHASVTLALLPTKGLPLPFVSYGRSFLVSCMIAAGLLLNVSQHSE